MNSTSLGEVLSERQLHRQRDPPQVLSLLHQVERALYALRVTTDEGEIVPVDTATVLGRPQVHWTLWLVR